MADQNLAKYQNSNFLQQKMISRFWEALIYEAKKEPAFKNMLDVGCGEGFGIAQLLQAFPEAKITGIDSDAQAVAFARTHDSGHTYLEGSIFSLPFSDNAFDCVVCTEVLEHLKEPTKALQEIARVASNTILISVPHEPWFRLMNFLRGRNLRHFGNYPYHLHTWSAGQIRDLVAVNCDIQHVVTPFPWTLIRAKKRKST
jgi:2-polyprenyl-3-methyl-5-hydroxy-6-metoxy-1,4-benzoquinol methylase